MFAWILKDVLKNKSKFENKIVCFSVFLIIHLLFYIFYMLILVIESGGDRPLLTVRKN